MMQAAQLAAEAAMREVAAAAEDAERNANSGGGGKVQMPNLSMMDMMHESSGSFMQDPSEEMMTQMESMQGLQEDYDYPGDMAYEEEQQNYHDEQQYYHEDQQYYHEQRQVQYGGGGDYNQMLLQEMQVMGIDPNDQEGVQFFLQYSTTGRTRTTASRSTGRTLHDNCTKW
jgi:hypothetical protein